MIWHDMSSEMSSKFSHFAKEKKIYWKISSSLPHNFTYNTHIKHTYIRIFELYSRITSSNVLKNTRTFH